MNDTNDQKPVIMFVDDDAMLLSSTRRRLRKMRDQWDIHYLDSGDATLAQAEKTPPQVVVSDMRMPGMDGAKLLARISKLYPQSVRIILSGQSDGDQLGEARGHAHCVLSKPCDVESLQVIVEQCVGIHSTLMQTSVASIVTPKLFPDTPTAVRKALQMVRDADCTLTMVRQAIQEDADVGTWMTQALDPVADPNSKPQVLDSALEANDLQEIKLLYCAAALINELPQHGEFDGIASGAISNGLKVAQRAAALAEQESENDSVRENAFMAGLLNEYGKLVLSSATSGEYSCELSVEAQRDLIGCTQADAATYLLRQWGLDPTLLHVMLNSDSDNHAAPAEPSKVAGYVQQAASEIE